MLPPQIVAGSATFASDPRPGTPVEVLLKFDGPYELPAEAGRVGLGSSVATYEGTIVEEVQGGFRARCAPGELVPVGWDHDFDFLLRRNADGWSVTRAAICVPSPKLPPDLGRMTFAEKILQVYVVIVGDGAQDAHASIAASLESLPDAYFPMQASSPRESALVYYNSFSGPDVGPVKPKVHIHSPSPAMLDLAVQAWLPLLDGVLLASGDLPPTLRALPALAVGQAATVDAIDELLRSATKHALAALRPPT